MKFFLDYGERKVPGVVVLIINIINPDYGKENLWVVLFSN